MPLEWTHDQTTCPTSKGCTGDTECPAFPTTQDRLDMARAAFNEVSEADGTLLADFAQDVLMLAMSEGIAIRPITVKASREWQRWRHETNGR